MSEVAFESAATKVWMCRLNRLVEANDLVMKLGADTANEPVAEWRHLPEQNRRAWLGASVRLWKWRKRNIALSHGLRSSSVYSGSSSP